MKKIIFTVLFILSASISYAGDISISADVDRQEIALDEQLMLTITVSGSISNIPQPIIPSLDGFTAYSSGRSQNLSIINGQVNSSVTFTYVLVPNDTGDYTIGPFSIDYKGNTYSTDVINVKVMPRSAPQSQTPYQNQRFGTGQTPSYTSPQEDTSPGPQRELFIETYVDKLRAHVNEQITLTFAFYQAVNLFENPRYSAPQATGFWTEDMPPQNKYYKMINGRKYLVTEIKTALFATSPGEFTIGSARLEATVEDVERFFSRRSPFDIFNNDPFSMFRRGKPIVLTTDPIIVEILPLPDEGKPANFKGDVGILDITANIDKDSVEENQPVTLTIKIKGQGNIKTISSPTIPEASDVKLYDSASSENISKDNYVVQGEKIFEKLIIPKRPGAISIGPIEYSFFDTSKKRYIEKKISPIIINASEAEDKGPAESHVFLPGLTKEEIKLLEKDISYIKTNPAVLRPRRAYQYKNKIFILLNILPLLILIFLYIYDSHKRRLLTNVGYARSRRAKGVASKRLKKARQIMLKENTKEFCAEIHKSVIEYVADRLNIPHASITKDLLEEKLKIKGISDPVIQEIREFFSICDMARFASARFTKEDMQATITRATDIISALERMR